MRCLFKTGIHIHFPKKIHSSWLGIRVVHCPSYSRLEFTHNQSVKHCSWLHHISNATCSYKGLIFLQFQANWKTQCIFRLVGIWIGSFYFFGLIFAY